MNLFVVRGENRGEPESYLLGVYATLEEAEARVRAVREVEDEDEDGELELAWIEDVELCVSVFLSNR